MTEIVFDLIPTAIAKFMAGLIVGRIIGVTGAFLYVQWRTGHLLRDREP